MAERVGSATVEVNADLSKLLAGLDKAKKTTNEYVQVAARQFANVTNAIRTAGMGMQALAGQSAVATTAMNGFKAATTATTAAVASASTSMRAYAAATPLVARSIEGARVAALGMTAAVASATAATAAYASKSSAASSILSKVGVAVAGITAATVAAGAGVAAFASRSPILGKVMAGLGVAATAVAAGFAAVAARAGPALAAAWRFANHPLGIFTLSALAGSPVLGAAMAVASTRAGPAIGRGLMAAGSFAIGAATRNPIGAAIGAAATVTGVTALVSALGKGFGAMAEGFRDARKASADLKAELEALQASAAKLTEELPQGSALRAARERQLRGVTGGLTSQFAYENAGLISSNVISQTGDALEEFTLRLGSARQASTLLAAALRRPEQAMTLLSNAGIVFTEQEKQMLQATRTFEERLRNAEIVIKAVNRQLGAAPEVRSGWLDFMYQVGQFLGQAPGTLWTAFVDGLKSIRDEIGRFTGLTALVNMLDEAFKSLAASMRATNVRLFGGNVQEEIAVLRAGIEDVDRRIAEMRRAPRPTLFLAPPVEALQRRRYRDMARLAELELGELARTTSEREETERRLGVRVEERLRLQREELQLLRAGNRAQLEAFRIAREEGLPTDDPRVQQMVQNFRDIEAARRRIAQAGQLTVFERENIKLEHQIQLFRYGNEEMERRTRLLQIQIAAAQRQQPLTEAQSAALLRQIELQQRIASIANTIESAFSTTFNSMADALASFATTGKFKFKELADSIVQQLVRIALQAAVIKPLMNAITGLTNPAVASLIAPGSTSTPITVPSAGGFAEGGSFSVPGGRTGDQPYLIGLSAGERVDVTPVGKGFGARGGSVTVNNVINSSRDFEVETREREAPDGSRIIEQVFSEVTKRIGRGDMDTTMGARFGVRPRTLQR